MIDDNCKTVKCKFKSILKSDIDYTKLFDCISRANTMTFYAYHFIRLYVLYKFSANEDIPTLDTDFILMTFKSLSKQSAGPKPKGTNLITYNKLCLFYKEIYVPLIYEINNPTNDFTEQTKMDSTNLRYIFGQIAVQMETA